MAQASSRDRPRLREAGAGRRERVHIPSIVHRQVKTSGSTLIGRAPRHAKGGARGRRVLPLSAPPRRVLAEAGRCSGRDADADADADADGREREGDVGVVGNGDGSGGGGIGEDELAASHTTVAPECF